MDFFSIIGSFVIGLVIGVQVATERRKHETMPQGRFCAYWDKEWKVVKPGKLFQSLDPQDTHANVCAYNPETKETRSLPITIPRGRVRFYTDKGENVNEANWESIHKS